MILATPSSGSNWHSALIHYNLINMAEISFFDDPGQAPQPRDQIRVETVKLEPYPDGRRVRMDLHVTPFGPADRPNLEISVQDEAGKQVASMSVIETMTNDLSLTIHLPAEAATAGGQYTVEVSLFYDPQSIQHTKATSVALPS